MFLNVLSADQQRLFLDAAATMLSVDGDVASSEAALLEGARIECGLEYEPQQRSLDELAAAAMSSLTERPARNAFLLELAGTMVVDGEEAPEEVELLMALAKVLDVSDEALAEFVAFGRQALALVASGQALVALGGEQA